jgi:hypothetical protein
MIIKPIKHKLVRINPKFGTKSVTLISHDNSKILNSNGTITEDTLIVYILQFSNGTYKGGQLLEEADNSKQFRKLPETVWQDSYLSSTRAMGSGVELKHLFIFSKSEWKAIKKDLLIDDALRQLVRKQYLHPLKSKKIPFSANVYQGHTTDEFRNKENLIMYNHNDPVHFEILKNICKKDLMGIDVDAVDAIKFEERIYQLGDVNLIDKKIDKHGSVLLNAYTSYGKSPISSAVAIGRLESQGGGLCIVTTPRPATLGDFETNPTKFDFGTKKIPIVIRQKEIRKWPIAKIQKHIKQGYTVFLLLSVQGVRYKNGTEAWTHAELNKYKKHFDLCDLWIRDEKWTEYGGAKTAKLMKQLEGSMKILDLAATSAKIKDDYEPDAIVDRSLFWAMKNRKKTELPQLAIDGIYFSGLTVIPKLADVFTAEENFNPRKLFVGNSSYTDFANLSILETLPEYYYRENALAKKLGISIVDDPDLPAISKRVGLWVLPTGEDKWPAEMYIPRLARIWNKAYGDKELYISAYELMKLVDRDYETTNDCINDLLNEHDRVVILTHRKYTVGSSIDYMGHIVLFDNISSDDIFEQLLGRILRLIMEGGKNIKTLVKVKAMVPNLQLTSTLAKMVVDHSDKTDSNNQAKEFFDLLGLKSYNVSGKPVNIRGEHVVDEIAKQRLATAGSGLKPSEVQEYLSDPNTVLNWQTANLPKIKFNASGKINITDDNSSKNAKGKKPQKGQKQNNFTEEQIKKLMLEGYGMVKIVSYCGEEKLVSEILKTDIIKEYFGKDLVRFILTQPEYINMMQDRLDSIYKNKAMLKDPLAFSEVMLRPNGFTDKKSIAFMPFGILDQDLTRFAKYKDHPFVVVNPLNGSMCESIKKQIGPKQIICVDTFGTFSKDLTNRGYQCYNNIGKIKKMKKRPVLLINSPYTSGTQDATNEYNTHIDNAITKLNPIAVLNIAPDNFLTGGQKNEKLRNKMIAKYGKPTYIKWLNQVDDWNKTIRIDTALNIWDENAKTTKTTIKGRFNKTTFEVKLSDMIIPVEDKEEYEYISKIQTPKKCRVKGFKETGKLGKQIKLRTGDKFEIVDGNEYTSNNNMYRQVVGYLRSESCVDVDPGPSIPGSYRELVSDYSPAIDKNISKKFGRYMRSGHTRWLVKLRYNSRSFDSPALSIVPMVDLNDLPDNFTNQDLYDYFDTPQNIIDKIIDYGEASPY